MLMEKIKSVDVIPVVMKFDNFNQAKKWAKKNIARIYSNEETGGKGSIEISNTAIDKYFNESSVLKSDNAEVHKSAISVLPKVIRTSIVGEIHADYVKKNWDKKQRKRHCSKYQNTQIVWSYTV